MTMLKYRAESNALLPAWHVPPPLVAGVAFGAQALLARRRRSSKKSRVTGAVLGVGSMLLVGSAVLQFRKNHTTMNPDTLAATQLVTTGPNQWTRNPMYIGTAGVLVAHAVYRRCWPAMLPVIGYVVAMDRIQIPAEEAVLKERFGTSYEQYRTAVPRWF